MSRSGASRSSRAATSWRRLCGTTRAARAARRAATSARKGRRPSASSKRRRKRRRNAFDDAVVSGALLDAKQSTARCPKHVSGRRRRRRRGGPCFFLCAPWGHIMLWLSARRRSAVQSCVAMVSVRWTEASSRSARASWTTPHGTWSESPSSSVTSRAVARSKKPSGKARVLPTWSRGDGNAMGASSYTRHRLRPNFCTTMTSRSSACAPIACPPGGVA
mmetsp:Transcript_5155/g.21203  ORF Transcript_5155/g.21203 Transcript_5155/m.21203 type:complete len:219 (+) Transcript_5155:758-1414(+)